MAEDEEEGQKFYPLLNKRDELFLTQHRESMSCFDDPLELQGGDEKGAYKSVSIVF